MLGSVLFAMKGIRILDIAAAVCIYSLHSPEHDVKRKCHVYAEKVGRRVKGLGD